jgi:hypothetical protein
LRWKRNRKNVKRILVIPAPIFIGINSSRNPSPLEKPLWFPAGVYPVLDTRQE